MKQQTFASLDYAHKKKQTRREQFLSEMERCIPWQALLAVIEPHYPRGGRRGGQPIGLGVLPAAGRDAADLSDAAVVWITCLPVCSGRQQAGPTH